MNYRSGWARFAGHFILYGAVPALVGFLAYRLGHRLPEPVMRASFGGVALGVLLRELRSYLNGHQTRGKTFVDAAAKVGGFAAGIFTANGWWI